MDDARDPVTFLLYPELGERWDDFTVWVEPEVGVMLEWWIAANDAWEQ
jgi:hypothetical protein